jgi:hypothetical protein
MDLEELEASLHYGNPFADAESMCRDEDEVRQILVIGDRRYAALTCGARPSAFRHCGVARP